MSTGDGKPDLLVANLCNGCGKGLVGVLLGSVNGTFQAAQNYESGGWGAESIAVGDVNRDGRLDVVVGNQCSNLCLPGEAAGIGVLLGNGDGSFQPAQTYPLGGKPVFVSTNWMTLRDINKDGKLDVVAANTESAEVLFGNGDGTFEPALKCGPGGYAVSAGDVNGDGNLDLLVANYNTVSVLLGNGVDGFEPARVFYSGGQAASAVAVGDVNADGRPDLLVTNQCRSALHYCGESVFVGVLLGHGDGTFAPAQSYRSEGMWASSLAVADVNEDGRVDVLVSNYCMAPHRCTTGVAGVLLGNSDGTFQSAQRYNTGAVIAAGITAEDINRDGKPDLLVANGNLVSVFLGRFGTTTTLSSNLNPSIYGQPITFAAVVRSGGPNTPAGTVKFTNGSRWMREVPLINGVATLITQTVPAGTSLVTATYSGEVQSIKSKSLAIQQVVKPAASATTLHSSRNPSVLGELVTFTATVASPTARVIGTVTFRTGGQNIGTVKLVGQKASITTSSLPHGQSWVTATYEGTANITGSKGSLTQSVK